LAPADLCNSVDRLEHAASRHPAGQCTPSLALRHTTGTCAGAGRCRWAKL